MEWISVEKLKCLANPFGKPVWGEPVGFDDVQKAIEEGRIISDRNSSDHAGRIAFFVVSEPRNPISIDVGVPGLVDPPEWIIIDGNHRLCGSIFAGRKSIPAEINGCCELIEELFPEIVKEDKQ